MEDYSVNEQLEKYEKLRHEMTKEASKQFKTKLIIGFLTVPLFGLGLILIILAYTGKNADMKALSDKFKDELLVAIIKDNIPDAKYFKGRGIDKKIVLATGLFKNPYNYFSEDLIVGKYKNMDYTTSDVTMTEMIESYDMNGRRIRTEVPSFKGKFIGIDLINNKDLVVIVTEKTKSFENAFKNKYTKVETESMAFNKKFYTVATSQHDAFYVLTPQLQEKMLELETKFRGSINFVFKDGFLYLLINDGRDSLEIYPNNKIDEKFYRSILSDITIGCAVIDEFSLDSLKWS